MDEVAQPAFNGNLVEMRVAAHYSCRSRNNIKGAKISEHGKGRAIAIAASISSKDDIKRRIEEATKYVDIDQLCLSPQCGFASTHEGNILTEDEQWRKLEFVVELADEIWGGK